MSPDKELDTLYVMQDVFDYVPKLVGGYGLVVS